MAKINLLQPHVADLIAAGEVVERPGSVVKELLENSIDAGARNVTLEIRDGGMTYIRVTDDGFGMTPEDAGIAFTRHATSKLKSERDLEAIGTLGFRGEALAAIAAVSRIEMMTRERGAPDGIRIVLEAGDILEMGPWGCPEGTTIIVRDLFYNTPARLKFMKSDKAEGSNCVFAALCCALGRPEVSLRCIKDGKEEFFSPGDGRMDSCIYSLLGRDMAANMLECHSSDGAVSVRGYVSLPHAGRGNRSAQYFFCNGRYIKSKTLQAALEQAYKNSMMTGRFPCCVLYIEMSFAAVDVNVHPTKREVKFSGEKRVFDAVYYAALSALSSDGNTAEIRLSGSTQAVLGQKSSDFRGHSPVSKPGAPAQQAGKAPPPRAEESPFRAPLREEERGYQISIPIPRKEPSEQALAGPLTPEKQERALPPESGEKPFGDGFRIVGEVLNTYIIVEQGDALTLIDKHAAHERIIFDSLKAQPGELMSQGLILPATFSPGAEDMELLFENGELLAQLGFEIEPYGEDTVVIRAVPADTDGDPVPTLEEILEKLRAGRAGDASGLRDRLLQTIACKAAIKAGRRSEPAELESLAGRVMSGEVKYCPHGRPVAVTLTRKELDREFKRI
ncbi:MAG TPA: DNA mismatch repair endonuclease MutL [Clostridiales bacterium]|nr:DNA mismatch repair endonuclease MutL [Clostridiales bacterium]